MTADYILENTVRQGEPSKKRRLPGIGLRIIKSSIAVLLCFGVYFLRGQRGVPFYSAIAAILCMQPYVANSLKVGVNRIIGTLIGGAAGIPVLLLELRFFPGEGNPFKYVLVSLVLIPLIYITLLLKKPSASYITCVVFLSVTVSHVTDPNPYLFALNRTLDTLIGIFISLGINALRIPRRRNKKLLLAVSLDGALAGTDGKISSYAKVKLNQLAGQKAQITLITRRTPATFLPMAEGITLSLPAVIMGGAALYQVGERTYSHLKTLSSDAARQVVEEISGQGYHCFVHSVIHDVLHIYYGELENPVEREYYAAMRGTLHKNYVCGALPEQHDALAVMTVQPAPQAEALAKRLMQLPCGQELKIVCTPDVRESGYTFVEVFSAKASYETAIKEIKEEYGLTAVAAFGGKTGDEELLKAADYRVVLADAPESLRAKADEAAVGQNQLVRQIARCFYSSRFRTAGKSR